MKAIIDGDVHILDVCCGGRMSWYDKQHPSVIYMDIRQEERGHIQNGYNPNHCVSPDVVADFRKMPFPDNRFKLIYFDPPHLPSLEHKHNSILRKKYGYLRKDFWKEDLLRGFLECWRCLDLYGTLVFKWGGEEIRFRDVLSILPVKPLFGTRKGSTRWSCFFKDY